jgi:ketosteroid isomerase-like protein
MNADDDRGVLDAIRQALEAAENAGDAEAAAALLTDDVVVMVPDFAVLEGKDACATFMRDMMTFSFAVSPKSGGDQTLVTGKYLWLLRRTAAEPWRIARLIVSRDDSGAHDDGCADVESPDDGV